MAARKHTHKYHRIDLMGTRIWACALDNCTHYMPKHLESMVMNKKSICWQCEREFKLTLMNMVQNKPKCLECMGLSDTLDILEGNSVLK